MSMSASRFPESEKELSTPIYSPTKSNNRGQESPIQKYMRQNNNFYLQIQEEAKKKQQSDISTSYQFRNLKQFQRQLQQQPSPKNKPIVRNLTPKNNSERISYSQVMKQEMIQTQRQQHDIAYEHRARQTRINGDKVIDKIKSFILDEKPLISPKSPKRKKNPDLYANVSSSIDKLYKQSQRKDIARRQMYIKKFTAEQVKQIKPFKVDNPVSLYLIDKKIEQQGGHKPLYQRAIDIARQKQQAQLQIQLAKQHQKLLQEQQEFLKFQQIKKQKYPDSATKEKQQKFYYDLQMKQKLKNLAKQQQKIRHLQQMTKQKPYVTKMTKQIFNKKIQRDQLSKNFVQRTQEYKFQRQKQKLKETQKYDAQYCPFAPRISDASRQLAQKYHERKKLQQENAKKKVISQKLLNKKLDQMSKNINKSKSPSIQKSTSNKRSNSSNLLNKQQKLKTNQKTQNYQKNKPLKQEQIPIYNRYIPEKKRTLSCVNVGCRKL